MAFGPFDSYAPPGVYTQTNVKQDVTGAPAGTRIPVIVGTGRETLSQVDFELVRGSSASVDQRIANEDASERFILDNSNPNLPVLGANDGSQARFQVRNFPIVSGDGQGATTSSVSAVIVTVNGELVSPAAVDGARGVVTLQVAPEMGDAVQITYYFNRTDTKFVDDLSGQVSSESAVLYAESGTYDIVSGEDTLALVVNGSSVSIVLGTGTGRTVAQVANDINAAMITGLSASVDTDNQGTERLQLQSQGSLEILAGTVNTALGVYAGQKTARNAVFFVNQAPIVTGTNGGITSTNPSDVRVLVNGVLVTAMDVDGTNGTITLANAPLVGSEVSVEYYHNTWQDTFDYLPNTGISRVARVGISPGRTDYIEGNDFVVDQNGRILWGAAVTIESGQHTTGSEFFDDTQIVSTLIDNRMYMEEVTINSSKVVTLGNTPTTGNGRDTELDSDLFTKAINGRVGVGTHRADLVKVYHGSNHSEALDNGPVAVIDVDPSTRKVTLKDAIPPDHMVWATYYYNRLQDDTLTLKVLTDGAPGTYSIFSSLLNTKLKGVTFGTKSDTDFTVEWASGVESNPDAFVTGTSGVNENVTVTFADIAATPAVYSNTSAGPFSFYTGYSDNLHMDLSGDTVVTDLTGAGAGTLISDMDADGLYTITTAVNDTFKFTLDGVSTSATLTSGVGVAGAVIAEEINRSAATLATLTGTIATDAFTFADAVDDTFNFTMNGVSVPVDFGSVGPLTAAAVAVLINAAIDATALTSGAISTIGNDGRAVAVGGAVKLEAFDTLVIDAGTAAALLGFTPTDSVANVSVCKFGSGRLFLRSQVAPATPDEVSTIRVEDGNANATLGFSNWEAASGAESAVNKAATLLSATMSNAALTNLVSSAATLVLAVNGAEYTVSFTTATHVGVASDITTALGAAGAATVVGDKIRITSSTASNASRIEIRTSTATQYFGFTAGQAATQRKVTTAELASVLNTQAVDWLLPVTGEFAYSAFADVYTGGYLRVTTLATGATATILFEDGADSALNDTGVGIKVGDYAAGVAIGEGFNVTSDNVLGSSGSGIVGQTYMDDTTGLQFSLLASNTGYPSGDSFTLAVNDTFTTGASLVVKAVAGTEMQVFNTTGIAENDTAVVRTFDKTGTEPGIGDFYYISYEYEKSDFTTRIFTRFTDIQANYGALSADNPLTLASYLAILNGAAFVGCKQVLRQANGANASSASFIDALTELARPITGGLTPDIIVPLSSDPSVLGAYVQHAEIQSSMRYRQERRCVFGVSSGTRPEDAASIARGLQSERAILVYPDSAIVNLNDELGNEVSFIVDGTYLAVALAGTMVSPQYDVATPLTRRRVVGFRRLNRTMDEPEKNLLATAGVTVLEDRGTSLSVRDGLTTDVRTKFAATPSIVAIKDFVQQQARVTLDRFVGLKFLTSRQQDVEVAMNGMLKTLLEANIITDFKPSKAEPDANDPTTLRVTAFYAPVFPLKYIPITFTVGASGTL